MVMLLPLLSLLLIRLKNLHFGGVELQEYSSNSSSSSSSRSGGGAVGGDDGGGGVARVALQVLVTPS